MHSAAMPTFVSGSSAILTHGCQTAAVRATTPGDGPIRIEASCRFGVTLVSLSHVALCQSPDDGTVPIGIKATSTESPVRVTSAPVSSVALIGIRTVSTDRAEKRCTRQPPLLNVVTYEVKIPSPLAPTRFTAENTVRSHP